MTGPLLPGIILPIDGGGSPVRFQYNPLEIEGPTAIMNWASLNVAGRRDPYLQFSHGEQAYIKFNLIYAKRSSAMTVVAAYKSLESLTIPIKRGNMSRPPICLLLLGGFLRQKCIVKEANPSFNRLFEPDSMLPETVKISVLLWLYPRDV